MKTELPRFEGKVVQAGTLRLTGRANDRVGALAKDEEVFVIVRGTVTQVAHADISVNGADVLARVHTVKASAVMLVDPGDGQRMLEEATMLADERFGLPNLFRKDDE